MADTDTEETTEDTEEEIISDSLVQTACGWLRISTGLRDDEIRQTAEACLTDLYNSGLSEDAIDTDDAVIQQAIKLYLKAQLGYDADAERFAEAYRNLRDSLALSGDYNGDNDG